MNFAQAIQKANNVLQVTGQKVETKTWQGKNVDAPMFEALNVTIKAEMPESKVTAIELIEPNLAWADEHFNERIGGLPLNPPPSHINWPWAVKENDKFIFDEKFSHTYPERIWPKFAEGIPKSPNMPNMGIRYEYGDLNDLIATLKRDNLTRQAYLPIWFPEDTFAAVTAIRVPCTIGYHFIIRNGFMHIVYYIRSCDIFRHMRDDIYLAYRLARHVRQMVDSEIKMGTFTMHITSLHCFWIEKNKVKWQAISR